MQFSSELTEQVLSIDGLAIANFIRRTDNLLEINKNFNLLFQLLSTE